MECCPDVIEKVTKEEPVLPRRALLEVIEDRAEPVQIFQKCPYTCVEIRSWYNNREYMGYGFSKVMYPDKWDGELGADIAFRRAIIMIYHQIRDIERGLSRMEAFADMMKDISDGIKRANEK